MKRVGQQDEYAKTALRLPRALHTQVHATAKAEERTFNAQLIVLIRSGLAARGEESTK